MTQHDDIPPAETPDAFEARVDAWLDGTASEAEALRLAEEITASPEAARRFARRAKTDHAMAWAAKELGAARLPPEDARERSAPVAGRIHSVRFWHYAAGIAAILSLGGVLFAARAGRRSESPVFTGGDAYARWDGTAPAKGASLPLGSSWTLATGEIALQWHSGATARIVGPATFSVLESGKFMGGGPGGLRLGCGHLSAHCPPSAHGFEVVTADGRFVDLGTEFSVARDLGRPTLLAVQTGKVRVEAARSAAATREVVQGKSVEVSAGAPQLAPYASVSRKTVVEPESAWFYLDGEAVASEGWEKPAFLETGWKIGVAPFAYPARHTISITPRTVIDAGMDENGRTLVPVKWFRTRFEMDSLPEQGKLRITGDCDDGVVLYLNGVEILRDHMPAGKLAPLALATQSYDDQQTWTLDASALREGENTLAASVHQTDARTDTNAYGMFFAIKVEVEDEAAKGK